MRRSWMAALGAGVSMSMFVLLMAVPPSAGQIVTRAAPNGSAVATLKTPAGVPAVVVLTSNGKRRLVTKKPTGTSTKVTVKLAPGTWRVRPQQVVDESAIYVGTTSKKRITVKSGATTSFTVTYRKAPSVTDLHVTRIEPTALGLSWTAPAEDAEVAVRRADGSVAPATATEGADVPTVDSSAVLTDLAPGSTHAFSVFARAPGTTRWFGPVSTVVTTPPAPGSGASATTVTNPSTVMITEADDVTTTAGDGKVRASVPAGTYPAIGQPWVLPPDATVPTGYLGKVVSVSADGSAVTLAPAGIADAFDYVELHSPDLSDLPFEVGEPAGSTARSQRAVISCGGTASEKLVIDPSIEPFGQFDATMTKREVLGKDIPVGMSFDAEFGIEFGLSAQADLSAGVQCGLDLPKITLPFSIGPVPMLFVIHPNAGGSAYGTFKVDNIGFTGRLGGAIDGYLGLGGDDYVDGRRISDLDVLTPHVTEVEGSLNMNLGSSFTIGVGSGTPGAGAVVGVTGTYNPLDVTASLRAGSTCMELSVQSTMAMSLEAKAWLGSWDFSRSIPVDALDFSVEAPGSPWYFPGGCGPAEYRISSGTVDVTYDWSASCSNDQGACDDGDPGYSTTFSETESSSASLRVSEPGDWAINWDAESPAQLTAPMVFNSWDFSARGQWQQSGYGCTWRDTHETVGAVQFGSSFWESGVSAMPGPDDSLAVGPVHEYYTDISDEWSPNWWHGSLGAWDTDWGNEFPRILHRQTWFAGGECGPYEDHYDEYHTLYGIGPGWYWSWPEESRRSASTFTAELIGECTADDCRWQVTGSETYQYRSDYADYGYSGSGSATVTWSFVVQRRPEDAIG